jgi:hypothetical protein
MPNYLISPKDIYSALDLNGNPLEGGQLFTYIAGSSTPTPTYTDASGTVENTNPIILDTRGEARVWLNDEFVYKYVLKTSVENGSVTIRTTDNIQANNGGGGGGLSSVTHSDSLTISLDGLGTAPSPLTADVLISSISANALGITTGGLYVSDLSDAIADKLDKVQVGAQSVESEVEFKKGIKVVEGSTFLGTGFPQIILGTDESSYIDSDLDGLNIKKTYPNGLGASLKFDQAFPDGGIITLEGEGSADARSTLLLTHVDNGINPDIASAELSANNYDLGNSRALIGLTSGNDNTATIMDFTMTNTLGGGVGDFNFIGGKAVFGESAKFENVPDGTPTKTYGQDVSGNLVKFNGADNVATGQGIVKGGSGEIKLGPHYLSMASSGVYSGGLLSVSGPVDANVNIGVTEGFIIDTSTFGIDSIVTTPVSVTSPIVFSPTNIATQNVTYVGLNSSGTQVEWNTLPTPEQRRDNIFLGVAIHSNRTTVEFVNNLQDVSSDITGQLHDLSRYLGYFNIEGNGVTANGANLNFNKAIGTAFKTGVNFEVNHKDPDTNYLPAKVASSFRYRTQTGGEGSAITLIDPTSYDVGGTITAIAGSNNQSTIQKIYIFPSNEIRIQYGQTLFSSFSDAISAVGKEPFVTESNIKENGLLLCSLVVKKGATDLSSTADALFFQAGRFGETGSVGSTAVGTLQSGYDNSINPEIITNATLGAVTLKRGSALDSDDVLEVQNGAGTQTFKVTGEGGATFGDTVTGTRFVSNSSFSSDYFLNKVNSLEVFAQWSRADDTLPASISYDGAGSIALDGKGVYIKGDNYAEISFQRDSDVSRTWHTGVDYSGGFDFVESGISSRFTIFVGGSMLFTGTPTFTGLSVFNDRILQGASVADTGEGIICESLKSEGGATLGSIEIDINGGEINEASGLFLNYRTGSDVQIGGSGGSGVSANLKVIGYIKGGSYTTTEKNALTGLTGGEQVFDSTLGKLCFYNGSAWETITSV